MTQQPHGGDLPSIEQSVVHSRALSREIVALLDSKESMDPVAKLVALCNTIGLIVARDYPGNERQGCQLAYKNILDAMFAEKRRRGSR